ncbi:hypothetical protein ACE6H2_005939 [Prunus campanulata]
MAIFSSILNCFMPLSNSQVSDDAGGSAKAPSLKESKKSKSKSSSGAPIIVSYFPHNSYRSRL